MANFQLTFKGNQTFDHLDPPPHFIDLDLGDEKSKLALEFGKCEREAASSAKFPIFGSGQQHRFADIS
jgi:hypothetical protein